MTAARRTSAVLLAVIAVLLCAPTASAHTELTSSTPKDGARLDRAPRSVQLTFSEPVDPADVRVTVGGEKLTVARLGADRPRTVAVAVPAEEETKAKGQLVLAWRVADEHDGHATAGNVSFHVRTAAARAARGGEDAVATLSPALRNTLAAARWVEYLALALFVGGLGFLLMLWPRGSENRRARTVLVVAWVCGLLATAAVIGLQGAYAAMGSLSDALAPATYADVLATDAGIASAARELLWLLAAVVLTAVLQGGERAARSPGWRVGAVVVCLGLLRTLGMTSHGSEGSHPGWGSVAGLVHLLGISLWIGGLVLLLVGVLPQGRPEELAVVVHRYSTLAGVSVAAVVGAGVVLSWQVLGSFGALFGTSYGQLLLLKVALLTVVLLVAQRSRGWVRTRLDMAVLLRGDRVTVRPFVYSVAAETGLVLAVLAAASVLVTAAPGR
ncbi:copper resistance CopC/CopD family protein [Streptomyces winkii]|uniref:copper resistance CopC/CopD family protein n=1 Tax=Streptomyces winkii TaxID=3051178 RepID=UPI0028D494DA|nr:copper resistance protein CopC [Streptomyces sp. DSM 40971]